MDGQIINTPLAAFTVGLVTSIHCAGMCGPLTCAFFAAKPGTPRETQIAGGIYHLSRLVAYSLIGGLLGAAGHSAAKVLFAGAPGRLLPWAFAVLFLMIAFRLDRYIPVIRGFSAIFHRLKFNTMPRFKMSAVLGLATPFLPCGPLYAVFAVALFAGSFLNGAELMAAFALGTMPLYWLLQSQYFRLQRRFSPGALQWSRQGLALVSALLLVARALSSPGDHLSKITCIFCR
jgi:sulfite exporter TauE/SafE